MNTEKTEQELKQLFSEVRAQDSRRVPSFTGVARAAAPAQAPRISFAWFRFAAGMAAVIVLAAGLTLTAIRRHTRSFELELQRWAALSEWKAPTDALLNVSSLPWGSTVTTPSDSLINTTTDSPDTTTENL